MFLGWQYAGPFVTLLKLTMRYNKYYSQFKINSKYIILIQFCYD